MSIFSTLIGGASAITGLSQGAYNLYKDINNTDIERQIAAQTAASKDLQQNQFLLNMQEAEAGRAFANRQRELTQAYNTEEANKAYARYMTLNSASRNAAALRLSGINPVDGAASASGSVGAASTSPANSPIASVSAPSFGAGSAHYAPMEVGLFADAEMKNSTTQLQRSQTTNQELRNKTQLLHDLTDIERMRTESYKLFKDGKLSEVEWKLRKYRLSRIEEITNKELDALEKNANAAVTNANANVTTSEANKKNAATNAINADTRKDELIETSRHNLQSEAIESIRNSIAQQGVNIEASKLESIIARNFAEADRLNAAQLLDTKKTENYVSEMAGRLAEQFANADLAKEKTKFLHKDVSTYYYRLALESIKTFFEAERDHAVADSKESKSANIILKIVGTLLMRKPV